MSNGVAVPATWPPADTSGSNTFPVLLVDEGSYYQKDLVLGTDSEVSQIVRVENLPDDSTAIDLAVKAATLAYPSHPSSEFTGMVLITAGPLFGHTHLKGNSMVVGREMTTDAGQAVKTVTNTGTVSTGTTGSTGALVLVKLIYGWPKKLSGF